MYNIYIHRALALICKVIYLFDPLYEKIFDKRIESVPIKLIRLLSKLHKWWFDNGTQCHTKFLVVLLLLLYNYIEKFVRHCVRLMKRQIANTSILFRRSYQTIISINSFYFNQTHVKTALHVQFFYNITLKWVIKKVSRFFNFEISKKMFNECAFYWITNDLNAKCLVTRSMLNAIKRNSFVNPYNTAEIFLRCRVLLSKCPELEARL